MKRTAFSLVELLVVIAIMGMLMSLLVPAAQKIREAAARLESANNLKQIGLAMHSHHDAVRRFPAGYLSTSTGAGVNATTLDGPPGWGWGAQLLRYLEQSALADSINFQLPAWDSANVAAVRTPVKVFLNPGAPNAGGTMQVTTEAGNVLAEWGRSHYVANVGQDEPWGYDAPQNTDAHWKKVASGPFFRNSKTRSRDVSDGLSNTVFVGEHTTVSDKTWVGVHPQSSGCPIDRTRYPFTECDRGATLVLCHSGPAADEPGIAHSPSFPTCHVCQMYSPWAGGGGLVLFGDGHVTFVPTSINLDTWAALSSMNLGDVPGEF